MGRCLPSQTGATTLEQTHRQKQNSEDQQNPRSSLHRSGLRTRDDAEAGISRRSLWTVEKKDSGYPDEQEDYRKDYEFVVQTHLRERRLILKDFVIRGWPPWPSGTFRGRPCSTDSEFADSGS